MSILLSFVVVQVDVKRIERPSSPLDSDFIKGGESSGNFGHAGRPGQVGGSENRGAELAHPSTIRLTLQDNRRKLSGSGKPYVAQLSRGGGRKLLDSEKDQEKYHFALDPDKIYEVGTNEGKYYARAAGGKVQRISEEDARKFLA